MLYKQTRTRYMLTGDAWKKDCRNMHHFSLFMNPFINRKQGWNRNLSVRSPYIRLKISIWNTEKSLECWLDILYNSKRKTRRYVTNGFLQDNFSPLYCWRTMKPSWPHITIVLYCIAIPSVLSFQKNETGNLFVFIHRMKRLDAKLVCGNCCIPSHTANRLWLSVRIIEV